MKYKQLLENQNLNFQEFNFQFQSHPNYPSALAFSDTLNFMGVRNSAYELEKEFWEELPEEFIAIYNDNFNLVKKEKNSFKIYSDEVKTISKEELYKNSTNFVMLFEKTEENPQQTNFLFSWFLYGVLVLTLVYSGIFLNWQNTIFNILSVIGLLISLEIFKKKFGKESVVISGICGGVASNSSSKNNCNKIIDSDKINFLGLKLSDCSLIYFLALLVLGIFSPFTDIILKFLSLVSCFVIGYSVVIQVFVEKAFCKICLLIICVLLAQIAISVLFFNSEVILQITILSVLAFAVLFFGLVFINDILKQKEDFRKANIKNLKFKRNYDIFKRELLEKRKINFENNKAEFFLGNPNAKLHISLVTNPYCGFCKEAHQILERLLEKYPEVISAQIRFNYISGSKNEKLTQLIGSFKNIYVLKGQDEFLKSIHFWFSKKDETIFQEKYSISNPTDLTELERIGNENATQGLNFTPIFIINGYQFPDKYDREDIFYFIDELLEDEDVINEN
jgi:uncharacterized membrane protein